MLDSNKIKIMTKLAIYEEKEGKEDIKSNKYYKNDYVRFNLIKTILSFTAGYVIILLLIGFYNMEYIIAKAVTINYKEIGMKILGVYLILFIIYVFVSISVSIYRYDKSRKRLSSYYKNLKELREIYKEDDGK